MKRLFTLIVAVMAFVGFSFAQTGSYTGTANIKLDLAGVDEDVSDVVVSLEFSEATGEYSLVMEEIELAGNPISLVIPQIQVTEIENGYQLEKDGTVSKIIPSITVPVMGTDQTFTNVSARITLVSGSVVNGILKLNLKLNFTLLYVIPVEILITYESEPQTPPAFVEDYTGTANVQLEFAGIDEDVPDVVVSFVFFEGEYSLVMQEMELAGNPIGLEIPQIQVTEIENGYQLEKDGTVSIIIPSITVTILGAPRTFTNVPAEVTLVSGSIVNDILELDLELNATVTFIIPVQVVISITFKSDEEDTPVSVSETSSDAVVIYPTIVRAGNIYIQGIETAVDYSIYSLAGAVVKSGTTSGTINVSELNKGLYTLNVNGKVAKFYVD